MFMRECIIYKKPHSDSQKNFKKCNFLQNIDFQLG